MAVGITDIQQAFVRQYMIDERVVGVRVRLDDGHPVLDVEVDESHGHIDLPDEYEGLPVRVQPGQRAVLAFNYS